MSEFRQYRLASQLLDRFNCLRDPKSYSSNLFSSEDTYSNTNEIERKLLELSKNSSEPGVFLNHARYLKEAFPSQFSKLVLFLNAYFIIKSQGRPSSVKGTPMKQSVVPSQRQTPLAASNLHNERKQIDELDDIAKKLEQVSHKLGRPVSGHLPVPIESDLMNSDFPSIQLVRNDQIDSLSRLPSALQELCIIEDLLFLVLNLNGKYFSYNENTSSIRHVIFVDDSIDPSILNRIKPVLKAAYCASRLADFISEKTRFNNGQVIQALCQSLDVILKEFFQVIMTLDKKFKGREIGLHQFCFHLVPFTRTLQSSLHLTFEIESQDIHGGALIRLLEDKISSVSGDRQLRTTYAAMLEGCSKPFLDILNRWLSTGTFTDAHSEFMILDANKFPMTHEDQLSEDLLTSRHSLQSKNTPRLLEDIQQKILLIGTYRNIQCILNKNITFSVKAPLKWDRRVIQESVNESYSDVNNALMTSLFQSGKLFDVMSAAKRFFFVESCDFLQNFLLNACTELNRTLKEASKQNLQGAFETALKTSCFGNDPFAESFQLELSTSGLYDSLVKIIQNTSERPGSLSAPASSSANPASIQKVPKISELLSMTMKVDFPESMILNSKSLAKYQIVYRHLTQCNELIRSLSIPLNRIPLKVTAQLRQFEVMKHSMLQFVRTMYYYICQNVLEPQWERFSTALRERRFTSVEEITNTHMNFLDTCLRECMLTNSKLVQLMGMIWSTCSKFSALVHELNNRITARTLNDSTFQEVMSKFAALHQHFLKYVRVLIEALQYYAARDCDHYIANFLNSLDCQFYA